MNIKEALIKVQDSPGSLFTKEDFINLLGQLEVVDYPTLRSIFSKLEEGIEVNFKDEDPKDIIREEDVKLELEGNELTLDFTNVGINTEFITRKVMEVLNDILVAYQVELPVDPDMTNQEEP